MTTDQPSSHPAPLRLALAPDWHVETIAPGVDVERSGLYEWRIEGAGSYVGQYRRISRPRRQYVLIVVLGVLNNTDLPVEGCFREALGTVARLGEDRAKDALASLDAMNRERCHG